MALIFSSSYITIMFQFQILFILKLFFVVDTQQSNTSPFDQCPEECGSGNQTLSDNPGRSWNALTAEFKKFIFNITYTKCLCAYSKFGGHVHEFMLIPDQLYLHSPRKIQEHFEGAIYSTEELMKAASLIRFILDTNDTQLPYVRFEGTSSVQFQDWISAFRKHYYETTGNVKWVVRTQLQIQRFEATIKTHSPLDDNFVDKISEIMNEEEREDDHLVLEKIKELVNEYGTHVPTSVVYGGNAFIDNFYVGSKVESAKIEVTNVAVIGGNGVLNYDKPDNWIESTAYNAVVISLHGGLIYSFLTSRDEFDKYNISVRNQVYLKLKNYILEYYKKNVRYGCVRFGAVNFDEEATVRDGTCYFNSYTKVVLSRLNLTILLVIYFFLL